jgi:acyl-coenzyme A synthetase/AMP-(fatty) acid ligase
LAERGVTHISGTPSHWRRALMAPAQEDFRPQYVRLSGEIADQAILDALRQAFPQASIGHAYASTEAGVGFEVKDGEQGFPAELVGRAQGDVELDVIEGALCIRSGRAASRYLGRGAPLLKDERGFIRTSDRVQQRGDRFYFVGRGDGVVNVGGLKVHPEEVEAVINRHDAVRMSLVKGRRNPFTGEIIVADVVLRGRPEAEPEGDGARLREEIIEMCGKALESHKVPAMIRFVDALISASGKLVRRHA